MVSTNLSAIEISDIKNMVHVIRGQQVMLDQDLADIYGYEVRALNQQVKRNICRFPKDFMFQLDKEELELVKSQFVISRNRAFYSGQEGGRRKAPYAFTEQGIYMLATVLRGELAERQSIYIMRAFREIRHLISTNAALFERISSVELKQLEYQKQTEVRLDQIFDYINNPDVSDQRIFFDGQIFDAFSFLVDLIGQAKEEIILIDGYVDLNTLNILAKKNNGTSVVIYTFSNTRLTTKDIDRFNNQYPQLTVKHTSLFHDRFLILDQLTTYHIGASIKDAGKKCFGITQIEDFVIVKEILQRVQ